MVIRLKLFIHFKIRVLRQIFKLCALWKVPWKSTILPCVLWRTINLTQHDAFANVPKISLKGRNPFSDYSYEPNLKIIL